MSKQATALRVIHTWACSGIGLDPSHVIDLCRKALDAPDERAALIDGAYSIVELWEAKSPSQRKWKADWLRKARKHGAVPQ